MTNKNHSKSDKKTRKYKQRRAQLLAEVAQLKKEGEEQSKKTDKQFEKASKKIEEVAEQQKETDKKIKAVSEQIEETGKEVKEVVEGLRQVRIATENNGDQIGGLSNKFGGYTEAMARPAIRRILEERFHAHYLGPVRFKSTNEVEAVEVDTWGPQSQRYGYGLPGGDQEQVSRKTHCADLETGGAFSDPLFGNLGAGRVSDAGGGGHQR